MPVDSGVTRSRYWTVYMQAVQICGSCEMMLADSWARSSTAGTLGVQRLLWLRAPSRTRTVSGYRLNALGSDADGSAARQEQVKSRRPGQGQASG